MSALLSIIMYTMRNGAFRGMSAGCGSLTGAVGCCLLISESYNKYAARPGSAVPKEPYCSWTPRKESGSPACLTINGTDIMEATLIPWKLSRGA